MSDVRFKAMIYGIYGAGAVIAALLGLALGSLVSAVVGYSIVVLAVAAIRRRNRRKRAALKAIRDELPDYGWITADKIRTGTITADKITAHRMKW